MIILFHQPAFSSSGRRRTAISNAAKKIETEVASLSERDLSVFRAWFIEFDAARWDKQLTRDVEAGNLDGLAAEALVNYGNGQCKRL